MTFCKEFDSGFKLLSVLHTGNNMLYKALKCCGLNVILNIGGGSVHNVRIEMVCVGLIRTVSRYKGGCFMDTAIYG